jgi:hypothetical protein
MKRGMNELTGRATSGHIRIDHPRISNGHIPLYRWTFVEQTSEEEFFSEALAAEGGAKKQAATELAEVHAEVAT